MKYIVLGVSALLLMTGCATMQPKPVVAPKPVEQKVEAPKKVASVTSKKHGELPPIPAEEEDVDMSGIVDQATNEVMGGSGV